MCDQLWHWRAPPFLSKNLEGVTPSEKEKENEGRGREREKRRLHEVSRSSISIEQIFILEKRVSVQLCNRNFTERNYGKKIDILRNHLKKLYLRKNAISRTFRRWINNVDKFNKIIRESALKWICLTTTKRVSSSGSKRSEPSSVWAVVTFKAHGIFVRYYRTVVRLRFFQCEKEVKVVGKPCNVLPCHDSAA